MVTLLFCLLLDSGFTSSNLDVLKIDKIRWQIEGYQDDFVSRPKYIRSKANGYVFFDDHDLLFYEFDLSGQVKRTFGLSGQGPGELNKFVRGIFFDQTKIYISHSNGFRLEVLDQQGKFLKTQKTSNSNLGYIYQDSTSSVMGNWRGSIFEWHKNNGDSIGFDFSTLVDSDAAVRGFSAMNWKNYLFIGAKSSNDNCICYVIIDTKLSQIVDARSIPTVFQSERKTYTKRFGEHFLPYVVNDVNASPELGFTILEGGGSFSRKADLDDNFIIVHCINPETDTHTIKKIVTNEGGINSILHVKSHLWVFGYSGGINMLELKLIRSRKL